MKEESLINGQVLKTVQQQLPQENKEKEKNIVAPYGNLLNPSVIAGKKEKTVRTNFLTGKQEGTYDLVDGIIVQITEPNLHNFNLETVLLLNMFGIEFKKNKSAEIRINKKEYAIICGVDISNTSAYDKFNRKLKASYDTLYNLSIKNPFSERQRGKEQKYIDEMRFIIDRSNLSRGYICVTLHPLFQKYINNCNYTYIEPNLNLWKLDRRNKNAGYIGYKLMLYNGNHGNKIHITNLLEVTNLPELSEVKAHKEKWIKKIREPFSRALEELTKIQFLKSYHFILNDSRRTAEEATAMTAEQWHKLYFVFEL